MAIQGFGNAGQYAALLGNEILGLKLIAASDSQGGIYNAKGLDPKQVVDYKLKTGSLQGFPGAERSFWSWRLPFFFRQPSKM
jgi:glutamate dehydrogenase (NAD(P)+)